MSGTKIAMPHPNPFQSGALSFMSCTSGRESSPLDETDPHQTTEFKTETKKKRFHPLRNLRRMFRRKTRRTSISADSYQPSVLDNPETTTTNLEHRSCSTSRLQEENLTQNLIRNSRLNPGLSLSHDSIFTPDRADSGLSSSDLENSSLSITVLTPPSKECPIKSQSSCSETSLLSIGSSEVELSPIRNAKISDLDLGVTAYKLSHSAAKHKMAVKPKRNHGVPRSRRRAMTSKSPLPITIEVSEEGATGRGSPPSETSASGTFETFSKCDKRLQEAKINWSDIASDSHAKESEEKTVELTRTEDELEARDQELTTQRSESFFGRFLSRRSDKKKKVLQEPNAEENEEKSHSVKKLSKSNEGKGGVRKTPNRRQRVEPMEIPSTSCVYKFEKEKDFVGRKISSSVSPPKSYWPSQMISRSMSPPKVIWPEGGNFNASGESVPSFPEKVKTDVSPAKQATESGLKDWKNPNFVKELTDSVSLFAREKSEVKEKDEEDETLFKIKRQHSEDLEPRKTLILVDSNSLLENKSDSLDSVESAKSSDVENAHGNVTVTHTEPSFISVRTPSVFPLSYETIHDGYENIQIIEQVKQEVRNSMETQPILLQNKPEPSPEPEKPVRIEMDFTKKEMGIQSPEKEPEVVKRVKPAVSEKPKDLKRTVMPEFIKMHANIGDPKSPEESNNKTVSKSRNTLVERRKSELMLLTEAEEKEWKTKINPLKKQTSFSETSPEKGNVVESPQKSPAPKEKESPTEKTELSPEITEDVVVVFRKKSVTNPSDEQPELMKVFARRSLKIRESEKTAEETQRSRDSDKENEIVESPKEDRKKPATFEREEKKETEKLISKESIWVPAKEKPSSVNPTSFKPEIATRNTVFQRYGRSLSENNAKIKDETEFKRDSIVLEENLLNKVKTVTERTKSKLEKEKEKEREREREKEKERRGDEGGEEDTGFKRIQQRKAEWERRAQQGAK